ncbi:CYTH domain-containing protein [Psychrosphaera sp. B3R10]|uniref:CYTH domain-containing protein n=1 Tax=unclassified Psychrosphaera TaxID=2641570 RepID=UPI001C083467|nr:MULTISPECIES: CYTH domain-containing protein [unclassified Psychrosphaera]MBU2881460.1 CYTH domain-containing protein [Psychrosphaera sp. I2R16]MBU2989528.1 CYTH domain-containing protein [Psychrosphaera sp. B3R10]
MEIELKFLLHENKIDQFKKLIENDMFRAVRKPTLVLSNAYFDTPDNDLRAFDMGLRTRCSEDKNGQGWSEQTVKLAGKDIGGLHQRPEHNVRLSDVPQTKCFADLTQFDPTIWPANFETEKLQRKLIKQFETVFSRNIWHITMPSGTLIECVLDEGYVESGENKTPICEIELELVKGNVADIFNLAQFLVVHLPLRFGSLSKAARGYMLVNDKTLESYNLEAINVEHDVTVEHGMIQMLSEGLKFVQHHEMVFVEQHSLKALRRTIDGFSQLIHILQLFSKVLPVASAEQLIKGFKHCRKTLSWVDIFYQFKQLTNRPTPYRNKIKDSESLSELLRRQMTHEEQMADASAFFQSPEYNLLILNLINWLTHKQWRTELSLNQISELNQPIRRISEQWLDKAWSKLKPQLLELKDVTQSSYIEKLYWPLATELLTGLCVGRLYDTEDWHSFRNPLVDLLIGCEELMLLNTLEKLVDENLATHPKLEVHKSWIASKQQSLLIAVSASTKNCCKLKPYW